MSQPEPVYPTQGGYNHKRTIADFRLNFRSDKYPILAFMYAILAGGEGALHFDYSEQYNAAYLLAPYAGDRKKAPEHVRKFIDHLDALEKRTEGRTKFVWLGEKDWDIFLDCLSHEVRGTAHSPMFW